MGKKTTQKKPEAQPPTPKFLVHAQPETYRGVYSNVAQIHHTQNEFLIDFLFQTSNQTLLVSRVILSPNHMVLFQKALEENLKKYEASLRNNDKQKNEPKKTQRGK